MRVSRRELHDGWSLFLGDPGQGAPDGLRGQAIAASVPGCVHTDLQSADLLADPHLETNEDDQHWIGRSSWTYRAHVDWHDDGSHRTDLVCNGLDTVAEIRWNGAVVGRTRNQHRSYRFDLRQHLVEGSNVVEIQFASPYPLAEQLHAEVGDLPRAYPAPYSYLRKMACNFGWDWGPQLVTAGIWRPIALEQWSRARLSSVVPHVLAEGTGGRVTLHITVEEAATPQSRPGASQDLRVRAMVAGQGGEAVVVDGRASMSLDIDTVERWWPVGMGEATTYQLEVTLLAGKEPIDAWARAIGFRTVEIDELADDIGRRWALRVNDRRVPVRGFNWIPDHTFPSAVGPERYAGRIQQAVEANANLLRVWGGGIYEDEGFYQACTERGVMVWQDFLFSCAAYPETGDYAAEVEAEAREAVTRLSPHPSLVLWNGNNECVWGWHDWGWQDELDGRPWGARYYFDLLPSIVAEIDPTRPYLPGSPWGGDPLHAPNDHDLGVSHLWDVWNERDYVHYREHSPSFVAEMGWCGPPTWPTMRRALPHAALGPDSPELRHHLRAKDGMTKLRRGLAPHFPDFVDDDAWFHALALNQARALTVGVEHLRMVDRCAGIVVWQLNDCWPVISWAAVDGDGRRKPVWYALRRAFSPRLVTIQPSRTSPADTLDLGLVNDTDTAWSPELLLRRVAFDGGVLAEDRLQIDCDAEGLVRLPLPAGLAEPADPRRELLVVDSDAGRATWWWAEDRDLDYPAASVQVRTEAAAHELLVTVSAETLLRDLGIFPERVLVDGAPVPAGHEVSIDEQLVTLLPGEERTFRVTGVAAANADALTRPPVLRAVNHLLFPPG